MRTLTIAFKDLLQIVRDWKSALFLVIMPIAFTTFFAFVLDPIYRSDAERDPRLPVAWYEAPAAGVDEAPAELSGALRDLAAALPSIRLETVDHQGLDIQSERRELVGFWETVYQRDHLVIPFATGKCRRRSRR